MRIVNILLCLIINALLVVSVNNVSSQESTKEQKKSNIGFSNRLKVKIGTEGSYVPFSYFNTKGKLNGFDIDLGNKICERLNYECEWLVFDWTNLFLALGKNDVQIVLSSRSLVHEKAKIFEKSEGYYRPYYVLTYHRDISPESTSSIDLASKTIGVLKDTIEADLLKKNYTASRIKEFAQLDFAYYALSRHEIDLFAVDYSAVTPWLAGKGDGRCCVYRPFAELNDLNQSAISVFFHPAATVLQVAFSNFLKLAIEDGTVTEIAKKNGLNPTLIEKAVISPYK